MILLAVTETALEQSNHDLLWAAVISSALGLIGVVVVALLANRNRQTSKDVAAEILDVMDTGNGRDLGHTARLIAANQEITLASLHTNTRAIEELSEQVAGNGERISMNGDRIASLEAVVETEGEAS